jgi:uncharacterized membrane protein
VSDSTPKRWGEFLAARSWWTAAGVMFTLWALRLVISANTFPALIVLVIAMGLIGLAIMVVAWLPGFDPKLARSFPGYLILVISFIAIAMWSYAQVFTYPAYGTDEAAFDQYAAIVATHLHDPYITSMAPSFDLFRVSPNGYTFLLNGHRVDHLSYPALAFELYMPLIVIGINIQAEVIVNVLFFIIALYLLYRYLPDEIKALAIVLGGLDMYIAYAVGGVTDALFMPFLIYAAYKWDSFKVPEAREKQKYKAYLKPVCLGLAMSIKQNAWLIFPLILISFILEDAQANQIKEGLRRAKHYGLAAISAFIIPNIAYIIVNPVAWLKGILMPIIANAVPAGQGIVGLTIFTGLGGGSLHAYTLLIALAVVISVAIYIVAYPVARYALFLIPSVILFFGSRSYGSYLVTLAPAALVGALSISRDKKFRFYRHYKRIVIAGLIVMTLGIVGAISVPAPLSIQIVKVVTTGQLQTIDQITIEVKNWTGSVITPAYSIQTAGAVTQFWGIGSGESTIGPNQQATLTLVSPSFYADPPLGQGFQVVAYTSSPPTVSESAVFEPQSWHVALTPDALKTISWPLGHSLSVKAQVLDQFDRPVHVAGIEIYMGQIIYGQSGVKLSDAIISIKAQGFVSLPGATPVAGTTNSLGYVIFDLTGTTVHSDPIYFEANLQVNSTIDNYPYGYSEILAVRFEPNQGFNVPSSSAP